MSKTNLVLLVLLAGCIGYIFGQGFSPTVVAGTSDSGAPMIAVTGRCPQQDYDLLYVIDADKKAMAVYDMNGFQCRLLAARNIKFDLQLEEYGFMRKPHDPSVKAVIKALEDLKKHESK
jgi:hypothetical protein